MTTAFLLASGFDGPEGPFVAALFFGLAVGVSSSIQRVYARRSGRPLPAVVVAILALLLWFGVPFAILAIAIALK
jgi:hypothetical protein